MAMGHPSAGGFVMLRTQGYLRVKEAASLLGVSPNTVRAWGGAGKIPEYRHPVNRYRMYKRGDLEKLNQQIEHSVTQVGTTRPPRRPR
jgi:DNA (cytosine-5)-methyltransferase 1